MNKIDMRGGGDFQNRILGNYPNIFIGDQNAGLGDRTAEDRRGSERHGDGFAGLGGHSANLEARRLFLRSSCRLGTPSLGTFGTRSI